MFENLLRFARRLTGGMALFGCLWAAALGGPSRAVAATVDRATFARNVDLENIRLIAVQHDGRFKTFDTLARVIVRHITGRSFYDRPLGETGQRLRQDPVFTYLDLIFNDDAYVDCRLIYVKKKPIRRSLVAAAGEAISESQRQAILADGLVSMRFLTLDPVRAQLGELNRDLMTTAKQVDALVNAAGLTDLSTLSRLLRVIPPPEATSASARWHGVDALVAAEGKKGDRAEAGGLPSIPGLDSDRQRALADRWEAIRTAWRAGDSAAASRALTAFGAELPRLNPTAGVYPPTRKLALGHWY